MTKEQKMVREFMEKARQPLMSHPGIHSQHAVDLGIKLIQEELGELSDAKDIVEVSDAIGDLLYVVLWNANAYGIDLEPVFNEIHRSNMSKFIDGHRREDGKWIKGPSYSPANLGPILEAQQ